MLYLFPTPQARQGGRVQTDFGILTIPLTVQNEFFEISPRADFEEVKTIFEQRINRDGYFYPGQVSQYSSSLLHPDSEPQLVEGTTRPAHLFQLRPSHQLMVHSPVAGVGSTEDAAFLVHLTAYLYGTRLQIEDWQFDGRIPKAFSKHHILVSVKKAGEFISSAYSHWRSLEAENRKRLTNIVFMHTRAPSYDWHWEQFLQEYIVPDALYEYARRVGIAGRVGHKNRIPELCRAFGAVCEPTDPVDEIVRMRNELFHAALWDDVSPGHSARAESYYRVFELRSLNQRLIAAAVRGNVPEYVAHPWTQWRFAILFE